MSNIFEYEFMKNAFWLIIIISPLFGLISTMIINNKLAYFSDALGHSAYMGIGIGILLGMSADNILVVGMFSVIFSILLVVLKHKYKESSDTIIGIISSIAIAVGIIILSNFGGIQKFSQILVGDLLLVKKEQIFTIFVLAIIIGIIYKNIYKKLILIKVDSSIAKSKNVNPILYEMLLTILVAITVSISINMIGLLLINSLFVLPAATSKNVSNNFKQYIVLSIVISMISGIIGLILSYYFSIPTGAAIVIICGTIYVITLFIKQVRK